LRDALAPLGLTPTQFLVLEAVGRLERKDKRSEGPSQQALALDLTVDKMTISQVMRALERRGLVDRDVGSDSSLAWAVLLTREGEALVARALPQVQRASEACLAPLLRRLGARR
jgi:DNA-binding MarR family transcriptional regulator